MTFLSPRVRIGLIGSGWMGAFHAETIAHRIAHADLVAVADPVPGAAERVGEPLGVDRFYIDALDLINDPDIDGVVIASPAFTHTDLVVAAAKAGKAIFVEKPMAMTLEDADRAIAAAAGAGVPLQVGFNRRYATDFAAATAIIRDGGIGTPQLIRSLTRDPGNANPGGVKPWAIFNETLIHDFDTINWYNAGARAVEVYAVADALAYPEFKSSGLLDTAVVTIRYDNGAIAVAEANFNAVYGYDVRGEVFGTAGMVTAGGVVTQNARHYSAAGYTAATSRVNIDLFQQAYTDELVSFATAIRTGDVTGARGEDARSALALALASRASIERQAAVKLGDDGRVL